MDRSCESSRTFCSFLLLLSGLAASQLWGIKMREGKVPARAPAFTSAYVNTGSFFTEKQGVIIKPFSDFCLIPHRGNKAGLNYLAGDCRNLEARSRSKSWLSALWNVCLCDLAGSLCQKDAGGGGGLVLSCLWTRASSGRAHFSLPAMPGGTWVPAELTRDWGTETSNRPPRRQTQGSEPRSVFQRPCISHDQGGWCLHGPHLPPICSKNHILLQFSQRPLVVKNLPVSTRGVRDVGSIPWSGRSPGEGNGSPLQYSCLENPHGQRSLSGCNPWDHTELDMTEVT